MNQTLENKKKKIVIMDIKKPEINNINLIWHIIILADKKTKSNPRYDKYYQKDKNKEDIALWKYNTILNWK